MSTKLSLAVFITLDFSFTIRSMRERACVCVGVTVWPFHIQDWYLIYNSSLNDITKYGVIVSYTLYTWPYAARVSL